MIFQKMKNKLRALETVKNNENLGQRRDKREDEEGCSNEEDEHKHMMKIK